MRTPRSTPPSLDAEVRQRIQRWMTAAALTQTALAARIGRNQVWVHRYLRGEGDADLATLQRIAEVFGRSLVDLLDLPRDPAEEQLLETYRALKPAERGLMVAETKAQMRPAASPRRAGAARRKRKS